MNSKKQNPKSPLVALWTTKKELLDFANNLENGNKRFFVPLIKTDQVASEISVLFDNDIVKLDFNRLMDDRFDVNPTRIVKNPEGEYVLKHRN